MGTRHPDIYVELANSSNLLQTLQIRTHNGFRYYMPVTERPELLVPCGAPRKPRTLREAQRARRDLITDWEDNKLQVKRTRYIEPALIQELNVKRFRKVRTITTVEDLAELWVKDKSFILVDYSSQKNAGRVYAPNDFGKLAFGSVVIPRMQAGDVWLVEPREDADEI